MRTYYLFAALILSASVSGCGQTWSPSTNTAAPLVWIEKGIALEGVKIDLGYRSNPGDAERTIEPIAAITEGGKPVANAMVFCNLLSADGEKKQGEEAATIYLPSAGEEKAHYGHEKLALPAGNAPHVVRFRIILNGVDQDWTHDLKIDLK